MSTFPILESPRVILHVVIPGEPVAWARPGGQFKRYDTQTEEKKTFRWQVKAACPTITPARERLAVRMDFYSGDPMVKDKKHDGMKFRKDASNMLKFAEDALNGLAWVDDSQIDEACVKVHRCATDPRTEILVHELAPSELPRR